MARGISRLFSLTKYVDLVITRSIGKGDYSDVTGKYVEAQTKEVEIKANIQPMKASQTLLLPESDRTKEWLNVWSQSEIRKMQEGDGGWDADTFIYNKKKYKVMGVSTYQMGVLDHYQAKACLDSPTPRGAING